MNFDLSKQLELKAAEQLQRSLTNLQEAYQGRSEDVLGRHAMGPTGRMDELNRRAYQEMVQAQKIRDIQAQQRAALMCAMPRAGRRLLTSCTMPDLTRAKFDATTQNRVSQTSPPS